ncbi:MAG: GDP-mannose 4,6-dehydratase [Acidimicrobiia bacterium]|nr:GDP-mannose 4,6-dehydratase [Acidimicrobiia bacterium]
MRALVTGGAGFVGRHLVVHLQQMGDHVTTIDRSVDGIDITDIDSVSPVLERARPEAVYHLAGWSDVGASWRHPAETLRANVNGTDAILRASIANDVGRVLIVTSADVYGSVADADQPIAETAPLRPESPYAASKAAAEMLAIQAFLGHGLPAIRARAFNHAGPGQRTDFVIPALAERVLDAERRGADVVEVGSLEPRRDFTDVRDVVRAYRALVSAGEPGECYNVCSGRDVSIGTVLDHLMAMAEVDLRAVVDPDLVRPVEVMLRQGDPTRITTAVGWVPEITLEQTLADVLSERRSAVLPPTGD